ncbi:methylated-DNA--[protein]-cysteine S-methyltransferase [Entomospira culicis]|uniref:Methylated-DNA--[protein]-cysteine S-methyltransferase n=1 Tax=Entomospira culicis TaxID=2719989 RepID=A0A968GHZ9_9SPIO|nr:methylated-DNA--[protein]-cysteine S-methyltransferase [Entomospira culicis]NIZ19949.1 methylated-DNA--[protein]-cysteine S-methyltransferase [Entomospira culicis]NIZ70186.1 methylated-DNA--[protein]-cysteine S-methyltransferase [Entomospira culicis]WDI38019.1 methylated-DNA--[protein]-cysteine S-methyltransferase [Entomospira culicis]WDI39642.1 methylated-DNA--[protein]-cysteine S-methyltransferase [Entomospira culicis]
MSAYYQSPIGWFNIEASAVALLKVSMVEKPTLGWLANPLEEETIAQLEAYFHGKLRQFTLPFVFSTHLSLFSRTIYHTLLDNISYGQRISYKELSNMAGSPGAMRAVGRVMAVNPIAVIIPCHRVVGTKDLGGYAWSLPRKEYLLNLELINII